MKKVLVTILAVLLVMATMLSMTACGGNNKTNDPNNKTNNPNETTKQTEPFKYPETPAAYNEKLTPDAIKTIPIKDDRMTTDELRKLCVDFYRFAKSAVWAPKEAFTYYTNANGTASKTIENNVGGNLFISGGTGNLYRLLEGWDAESGKIDITKLFSGADTNLTDPLTMAQAKIFANQSVNAAYWAWGRVVNSAIYWYTANTVPKNGYIWVGEYPNYDSNFERWVKGESDTPTLCAAIGAEQMYKNYAAMKLADGIVSSGGSNAAFAMCTVAPVVYDKTGNQVTDLSAANLKTIEIDAEKSYIGVTAQGGYFVEATSAAGDKYEVGGLIDEKWTFAKLFTTDCVPFTFEEFVTEGTVEKTEVEFSHKDANITASQLFAAEVTANYGISDVFVIVKDSTGKEVYRHIVRADDGAEASLTIDMEGAWVFKQGTLTSGEYDVEVLVQLSTGECPTVYTGKLKA